MTVRIVPVPNRWLTLGWHRLGLPLPVEWLSGPADQGIIFELPYPERWGSAARLLGVDLDRLSGQAGHA